LLLLLLLLSLDFALCCKVNWGLWKAGMRERVSEQAIK